jgi:pyrroloquinoline-quinone synthase
MTSIQISSSVMEYSLLKHPYYQSWNRGELTIDNLKDYSCQYFHHVNAFPRYISSIHSKCEDLQDRQVLLDNLIEEEKGEENHPELWLRFAESLGASRDEVKSTKLNQETKNLVDGYLSLCSDSYAKGLGALYAYESQVPEVAKSKIDGLQKFYGITSEQGIKFFKEHISADEWHSEEVLGLIEKLPIDQKMEAKEGAITAAKLLWGFLDGMMINTEQCLKAC